MYAHITTLLDLKNSLFTLMICLSFSVNDPSLSYIIPNKIYFMQLMPCIKACLLTDPKYRRAMAGECAQILGCVSVCVSVCFGFPSCISTYLLLPWRYPNVTGGAMMKRQTSLGKSESSDQMEEMSKRISWWKKKSSILEQQVERKAVPPPQIGGCAQPQREKKKRETYLPFPTLGEIHLGASMESGYTEQGGWEQSQQSQMIALSLQWQSINHSCDPGGNPVEWVTSNLSCQPGPDALRTASLLATFFASLTTWRPGNSDRMPWWAGALDLMEATHSASPVKCVHIRNVSR